MEIVMAIALIALGVMTVLGGIKERENPGGSWLSLDEYSRTERKIISNRGFAYLSIALGFVLAMGGIRMLLVII